MVRLGHAQSPRAAAPSPEDYDEVTQRITAWLDAGAPAASGVDTFYDPVQPGDEDHAVATMIFNAWAGQFRAGIFDDEGLPDVWEPWSSTGQVRAMVFLVDGRGPDNPLDQASWNPDTQESAFFDVLGTEEVETANQVSLAALDEALDAAAEARGRMRAALVERLSSG